MKDNNVIKNFIAFNVLLTYTDNHGQLHLWLDQHKSQTSAQAHWDTKTTVLILLLNEQVSYKVHSDK